MYSFVFRLSISLFLLWSSRPRKGNFTHTELLQFRSDRPGTMKISSLFRQKKEKKSFWYISPVRLVRASPSLVLWRLRKEIFLKLSFRKSREVSNILVRFHKMLLGRSKITLWEIRACDLAAIVELLLKLNLTEIFFIVIEEFRILQHTTQVLVRCGAIQIYLGGLNLAWYLFVNIFLAGNSTFTFTHYNNVVILGNT